jgi:hypothetical protein
VLNPKPLETPQNERNKKHRALWWSLWLSLKPPRTTSTLRYSALSREISCQLLGSQPRDSPIMSSGLRLPVLCDTHVDCCAPVRRKCAFCNATFCHCGDNKHCDPTIRTFKIDPKCVIFEYHPAGVSRNRLKKQRVVWTSSLTLSWGVCMISFGGRSKSSSLMHTSTLPVKLCFPPVAIALLADVTTE